MIPTLLALLAGCGSPAPAPQAPTPSATPEAPADNAAVPTKAPGPRSTDPMAGACRAVVTPNDATAIYQVGRGLKNQGACTFEDVKVEGSDVVVAFETSDGTKAPADLKPSQCVDEPPAGAVVKDPWVLSIPKESQALCPVGFKAFTQAMISGQLPPPSTAK